MYVILPIAVVLFAAAAAVLAVAARRRRRDAEIKQEQLAAARAALAEARSQLDQIVANAPISVSLRDREGRYRMANDLLLTWMQRSSDEVIGKSIDELYPVEFAAEIRDNDHMVIEAARPVSEERQVSHPDGKTRHIMGTSFPAVDAAGRVVGVGTIGLDVTEWKAAERRLEEAQRMEALGQLTGGIAHDFNNLLTVVRGSLELLGEGRCDADTAQRRIAMAMKAADRGAELTQNLLSFAKRQRLSPEAVPVAEIFVHLRDLLDRTLREDIALEIDVAADIPEITIDSARLETALVNLSINAQEAMPSGGTLTIRSWLDAKRGDICISLGDTGVGMRREMLDHVYDPFFTTKGEGQGKGLGLSMVRGFVEQSGGVVEIDSEPGRGTTVQLRLPVKIPALRTAQIVGDSNAPPLNILLVEDEEGVRDLTVELLNSMGHTVVAAASGIEAMETYESHRPRPDLLISDLVLPGGISGRKIVQSLRAADPRLPAVVMSGYADTVIRQEGALPRDVVFLRKPFSRAQLAAAVNRAYFGEEQPRSLTA
jgi:PAS domain S-box-containing protein